MRLCEWCRALPFEVPTERVNVWKSSDLTLAEMLDLAERRVLWWTALALEAGAHEIDLNGVLLGAMMQVFSAPTREECDARLAAAKEHARVRMSSPQIDEALRKITL